LIDYQAVRWGLAKLKPGPRWPEIETRWTRASGIIPPFLDYDNCLTQARQLVESFQDQIKNIHPDRVKEYADGYR
jgi:hypothetical protein